MNHTNIAEVLYREFLYTNTNLGDTITQICGTRDLCTIFTVSNSVKPNRG